MTPLSSSWPAVLAALGGQERQFVAVPALSIVEEIEKREMSDLPLIKTRIISTINDF